MHENYYNNTDSKAGKIACIIVLIVLGTFLISSISIGGMFISTYNNLVDMEVEVELAKANVENMMQRRLLIIPDLVSTVQAATKYGKEIYADITDAREALANSFDTGDLKQISEANENLSIAVNNLIALAEDSPELAASEQYTSLMDQIEGSVNRISIAREAYNEKVADYNKVVRHFPGSILAGMFGFHEMEEFEADEAANNTNMVNFN